MASGDREIEVKFYLHDLAALEARLVAMGAELAAPRVYEINLRFDRPDRSLQQAGQVLRLRKDANNVVTYKGPSQSTGGASSRQEIEFQVSDFEAARRVFEALGYRVVVMYEKYRTTYQLGEVLVVLDELPFGHFAEVEGGGADHEETAWAIRTVAEDLGLDWDARITASYLALFDSLRARTGITARNLSFEELRDVAVGPKELNIKYAD